MIIPLFRVVNVSSTLGALKNITNVETRKKLLDADLTFETISDVLNSYIK